MDLVVGNRVVVEIKTVEQILPVHTAQLLTYLKLSGLPVGLIINFNVPVLRKGIKRVVNHFTERSARNSVSAPFAPSGFDFKNSPRLCASAVKVLASEEAD